MLRIFKFSGIFCLIGLLLISNPTSTRSVNAPKVDWVETKMSGMTLDEKIAQLFMIEVRPTLGPKHLDEVEKIVRQHQVGGLIFFKGDPLTQVKLTNKYQAMSKTPMFVAIDGEWGLAMRLSETVSYPYEMALGGIEGEDLVYQMGRQIGKHCRRMGIHINFAPVVDINNNPKNPVINFRSFGEDRFNVAKKGWAYAKGMQDENVMACAKHFPGHGDTDTDSHLDLPVIRHNRQRLDSLEFFPFRYLIDSGVMSVMTAHLFIPAIDNTPNQAISVSEKAINGLLKTEMGFKGLAITDALNMQGVAKFYQPGELDLKALIAGNDILLGPGNVPKAIEMIKTALTQGKITKEYLDAKVRKILNHKLWAGLDTFIKIDESHLKEDLNTTADEKLLAQLAEKEICLVKDQESLLPLKTGKTQSIISIAIGTSVQNEFQKTLKLYAPVKSYQATKKSTYVQLNTLASKSKNTDILVISLHGTSKLPASNYGVPAEAARFVREISKTRKVVFVDFGNAYNLKNFSGAKTVVLAYEDQAINQMKAAQAFFGAIAPTAHLPVTVNQEFYHNMGLTYSSKDLLRPGLPSEVKMNGQKLSEIDKVVNKAIKDGATPGCQVLLAKDGKIIFQKSYGHTDYNLKKTVTNDMLYDLASITKVAATTMMVMKLYEEGKLELDDKLSKYLPAMDTTDKKDITIRQVLTHKAGLRDWIPFYQDPMNDPIARDTVFSSVREGKFSVECGSDYCMNVNYIPVIFTRIYESKTKPTGEYLYSDLGMILMRFVIEKITGEPLDVSVQKYFYEPMGMMTMTYTPLKKFDVNRIVPTEKNPDFRKGILQGYVHDPGAAMLGGVSGHAGLFSNATDLAILMQMLLNGGTYNGVRFLKPETIELFTKQQSKDSRRGLGFDKAEMDKSKISPASQYCSAFSFGHTGFTGTQVWADPKQGLIYVFLSNRTNPSSENRLLIKNNVRTDIMDIMYQAVEGE
jgi:beta-glucosidase-like glycosyl hydrolase/CubicO group peptidase (beta-lactamase class C family)